MDKAEELVVLVAAYDDDQLVENQWGALHGMITQGELEVEDAAVITKDPESGRVGVLRDLTERVIVASKGGEDTHPAWYLNLVDQPRVQVALGGAPAAPYDARVATPEERAEMWPTITSTYKGYAGYQRKTDREIPLVVLTPAG